MAIEKRTGNETPRPVLGKTAKSQRVVRFVDLNDSLNKVEEAFVQLPANPSNGDALVYNSTTGLWEAGAVGDPTLQTAVVEISSAEILTMGTSPIELLPAPGVGMYYDIEKIVLEYTHITTGYTGTYFIIKDSDGYLNHQLYNFTADGGNTVVVINDVLEYYAIGASPADFHRGYFVLNKSLLLTHNATDPTLGDGTLRAIINYRVRTFGA